jgi:glycosyltransferase involved in cell wall biosynthesis
MRKNLALFLTYGLSISSWDKIGSLNREIKPYIRLAENFKEIYVFSYGTKEALKYSKLFPNNVKIISKPKFFPNIIYSLLLPIIHFKILSKVDILKTNQMSGSWTAVIAKKIYKNNLVVRCGYEWLQYLEKVKASKLKLKIANLIEKFAYKNANKIIITSNEGKDFIKNKFLVPEDKIVLNPNYVDIDRFKSLDTKKESGRIIFVGRLDPVKNLENLIKGMKGLNASLVIIGEGLLKNSLESLAKSEGVSLEFRGIISQERLPYELNQGEIFVLPSISEGNPKVLLEAMSCGLPCLGSDILSIREIIKDGESGILCQTDVGSIHQALARLLDNTDLRKQLGINARQIIIERFSFEKIIEKELNIYDQILR